MAFTLLIAGAVLLVAAVRNTQGDLFDLLQGDFVGPKNFIYWTLSILLIGALGYIPKLKALSVSFLVLVIIVLILKRGDPSDVTGGFFQQFTRQINSTGTGQPVGPQQSTGQTTALNIPALPNLSTLGGIVS